MAVLCGLIIHLLSQQGMVSISIQPYATLAMSLISGLLLGVGALVGDIAKSAFKRCLGFPPGSAFPVVDGIDYMVGAIIFFWLIYQPTAIEIIILLVVGPLASLSANCASYCLGWKQVWY